MRLRCKPRVKGLRFVGSRKAQPPTALKRIMSSGKVSAVIVCPSNPYVSIAPILSVPAIRTWLKQRSFPIVAVSPIVGGAALKGPASKMMKEFGSEVSALGVARHYQDWVDGWVIDNQDAALRSDIEREGKAVMIVDTIMSSRAKSAALAKSVIGFAKLLAAKTR